MPNVHISSRLGVCSWSLQAANPAQLIQQMQQIGLNRLQCALDPIRATPEVWGGLDALCASAGLQIVSGMFGTVGEDYTTLESIRRTGGVVPDQTWEENWRNIQANAQLAQQMNLKLVGFHAGFLPHQPQDPDFANLLGRIRQIADLFADHGIDVALETGQETAPTLRLFLERLNRRNVGVNFDPANMILYDKGDPIEALREVGPWVKHCHIKDALRTQQPGAWGQEVVVGTGQVNWPAFFRTLAELKFEGCCCIEREWGDQRVADIRAGRQYIENLRLEI
jgi:sugar phosphate isomerase/epimerase